MPYNGTLPSCVQPPSPRATATRPQGGLQGLALARVPPPKGAELDVHEGTGEATPARPHPPNPHTFTAGRSAATPRAQRPRPSEGEKKTNANEAQGGHEGHDAQAQHSGSYESDLGEKGDKGKELDTCGGACWVRSEEEHAHAPPFRFWRVPPRPI